MGAVFGPLFQQAATGTVVGAAGNAIPPPGAIEEAAVLGRPPRGRLPLIPPIVFPRSTENVSTNRYQDNKNDKDDRKCKLFAYKDKAKECPDGQAHHVVPDRCWRSPGSRGSVDTGLAVVDDAIDDMLQMALPWRRGGYYYGDRMDEKSGLAICVSKSQHKQIHAVHNPLEKALGENGSPQWTGSLGALEDIGAASVSAITGCNKSTLKEGLRAHHQKLGLDENTIVRADPSGRSGLTMEKFAEAITKKTPGGPIR